VRERSSLLRGANWHLLGKLSVIALVMFGFGFAMIPIYRSICEITGAGMLTRRDEGAAQFARNTQVDASRTVVVEFDANPRGAWQFRPERRSIAVHPGELVTVEYELVNTLGQRSTGQAVPSYAPEQSAAYFRKIECFCFNQQALEANEVKRFPVVFVVDPKLPAEVGTITLSYTFFEVAAPKPVSAGGGRV
jgi:cytochrome c oxidase assembly protein subunit 11